MKVIGWQLARLVAESQTDLLGATIEQIRRSPDRARLVFVVGSRSGKVYVVLGVRGESSAFYWTRTRSSIPNWDGYERTEAFNRLRSAHIIAIGMADKDRVVRFEFEKSDEDTGAAKRFSLVAGWIGSMSNIWLLEPDGDTILESFHIDIESGRASSSTRRQLQLPAPPEFADWRTMSFPEYRELREQNSDMHAADFMRHRLWGIDPGLARMIAEERRRLRDTSDVDEMNVSLEYRIEYDALRRVGTLVLAPETALTIANGSYDPGDVRLAPDDISGGSSLAEILASCDARTPFETTDAGKRKRLFTTIETAIKKTERRLVSLERTLAESGRAEEYKFCGDLLSANRPLLKKGKNSIELEDWRNGKSVLIALNPARSPQQNIDDYYRKSRKASDAVDAAKAEKPHLMREQERLRNAMRRLEATDTNGTSVEEIASSLGWDTEAATSAKQQNVPRLPYREFALGKDKLWVGRSSRDNDELTLRYARPQDIFFHVHGAPGSHVILKRNSKDAALDKDTITLAAQVAAYFSKAKHAGLVPVVYAEARFVRKPRKAPAGTVSVEREKTIMVRPLPPPGYHESKTLK
jgi:predicted ribosome quality control (RQC) complex YloA/Tae2 family protein